MLAGLDIGTTTLCGLLLEESSGEILAVRSEPNAFVLPAAGSDESLQDPEAILGAARRLLESLLAGGPRVAAIGVTGQMHGILYVDRKGRALSPLYTWQDGRGERELSGGQSYAAFLSGRLGSRVSTGMGAVTHFWLARNGGLPAGAAALCTIPDFVAMRLAGASAPRMDPTLAASLGCFDLRRLSLSLEGLDRLELDPGLFPPVVPDYPELGRGPGGAAVFTAVGDNQASILGSLRHLERSALLNIGTGSQVSIFQASLPAKPGLDIRPFPFGGFILVGAALCGGRAYSLLREFFERTVRLFTGGREGAAWEIMNGIGPEGLPGAERLIVDTRFSGTRAQPGLRAGIGYLSPTNFTPEHLIVGVREGIAAELFALYQEFGPEARRGIDSLVGAGNAVRLNPLLLKALEGRFGLPVRVPAHREEASFGAALLAGVASGLLPDRASAGALIRYRTD